MYQTVTEERISSALEQERASSRAMGEWLSELRPWSHFVTLTYDPSRREHDHRSKVDDRRPPPLGRVDRDLQGWLLSGVDYLGAGYVAVAAPEIHKSGWPHVHLICDSQDAPFRLFTLWAQEWYKKHGYAKVEPCRSQHGAAQYCGKYLAKQTSGLLWYPFRGPLHRQGWLPSRTEPVKGS